jgi:uncharacterized damage-inducible protein DinB
MLPTLRKLWAHLEWADETLLRTLEVATPPPEVVREYAHILGADEVWLARLTHRASRFPVWPSLTLAELRSRKETLHEGYRRYIDALKEESLAQVLAYTNTAGKSFENPVGDLLLHVSLHAQYHRGKINLLLRQAGLEPVSTDYIVFVRAVTPPT